MLAGPLAVVAVVLASRPLIADRHSEQDFFPELRARARTLYVRRTELLPLTPLLGAGDRRECRHWMQGPLGEGLPPCGLGHYVFHERHGDGEQRAVDLARLHDLRGRPRAGHHLFPGVFVARRRDLVDRIGGGGWLATGNRRRVELESAALCERYELWVERSQDDLLLRQLFAPVVRRLARRASAAAVLRIPRRHAGRRTSSAGIEDAGRLSWLLDATAEIARRFAGEVSQAAPRAQPSQPYPANASVSTGSHGRRYIDRVEAFAAQERSTPPVTCGGPARTRGRPGSRTSRRCRSWRRARRRRSASGSRSPAASRSRARPRAAACAGVRRERRGDAADRRASSGRRGSPCRSRRR